LRPATETRPKPSVFCSRRDGDRYLTRFSRDRDKTKTFQNSVSRPSQDRDFEIETSSLLCRHEFKNRNFSNDNFCLYFLEKTISHLDHYIRYVNFQGAKRHRQSVSETKSDRLKTLLFPLYADCCDNHRLKCFSFKDTLGYYGLMAEYTCDRMIPFIC